MSSHRDNRDMAAGGQFSFADRGCGFKTIHLGHLHVHQHHIKRLLLEGLEGKFSIHRYSNLVAPLRKGSDSDFPVNRVVFGEQYAKVLLGERRGCAA